MSTKLGFAQIDSPMVVLSGANAGYGQTSEELEDGEWNLRVALAPPVKDPMTRLLDLLAGWSAKATADEFPDNEAVRNQIADLYQEVGEFAFDEMTPEVKQARIRAFLTERVLPTLTM